MRVPPHKEVPLGQVVQQIIHGNVLKNMSFGLYVLVKLYADQHDHDQQAENGVDDESGKEETIDCEERIIGGLVVACVDGFDDGKKGARSEDADCHFEEAPRGRGRDD